VLVATRLVREFAGSHPHIELDVTSLASEAGGGELAGGSVDVAVVRLPVTDVTLACQAILEEPRVAVMNVEHPLARRESLTLADLRGEPLLLPRGTEGGWERGDPGVAPRLTDAARAAAPAAARIEELIVHVAARRGVGVVPASLAGSLPQAGFAHVPVSDAPASVVALVWRRNGAIAPVPGFVQTAVDVCSDGYRAAG